MFDGGLFEIFQHEFGMPGARRFEAARQQFLESTAAYRWGRSHAAELPVTSAGARLCCAPSRR